MREQPSSGRDIGEALGRGIGDGSDRDRAGLKSQRRVILEMQPLDEQFVPLLSPFAA